MTMPAPLSAAALAAEVLAGRRKAVDIAAEAHSRAEAANPSLGAFLSLDRGRVLAEAEAVDRRIAAGERPPLAGVPVAVKDNLSALGHPCTCASKILANYRPPYDATVVRKLKEAGAVVLGKTNLDEFAMGSSNENSAFGPVRNPWDPRRTPGGSSGGSAAAVAAGLAPISLGSDTGGSIRQPAAFTGTVGLKPTYGRVSRYGLVAFGSSLDQIGPFARNVRDAALVLGAIEGADAADATVSSRPGEDYLANLESGVAGLRVGLPEEYFGDAVDPDVREAVEKGVAALERGGARIVRVKLPHTPYAIPVYYIVATAEASSNLARFDGVRFTHRSAEGDDLFRLFAASRFEGFGPEVRRRILLGTYCLSSGYYDAYYERALRVRTLIARDFDEAFRTCDVLAAPTTPTPAFKLGEKSSDPLQMYLSDILTGAGNLAGVPGLVTPCGFVVRDGAKLPVGLQLTGPRWSEGLLFRAGRAVERDLGLADLAAPEAVR
jgi:aspartyl-tRNA(Asn)/glutamyl-tRNA(Gln) amidotransferase subunit A